jgi:fructokinase
MDSRNSARGKNARRKVPTIIGTGLIALDVVIADSIDLDPILCAGGTCGNVLAALAFLDWNAYPIARLRSDAASKRVTEDLKAWGVRLDFVAIGEEGSTPVVVQHIRRNKAGEPSHSFSRKCPKCGTWLPWYKAVRAADVSNITSRLPAADVFYFDRTSRGAIEFARHAKDHGSLVVFEPSSGSEPALLCEALKVAHIVKIASDRLDGNKGILDAETPYLIVETQGANGLRYKYRTGNGNGRWKRISAFTAMPVTDTAGAGDWCTAGIISQLGKAGVQCLADSASDVVTSALMLGQAMAAWACQFHGARGGMYESTKRQFIKAINALLEGNEKAESNGTTTRGQHRTSREPLWCDCCLSEESKKRTIRSRAKRR